MHFVFISLGYHPDRLGGAYRVTTEVAERLAQRGHCVDVYYPGSGNSQPSEETRKAVRLHRFPNATGFFADNWWRENRQVRLGVNALLTGAAEPALLVLGHAFFAPACWRTGRVYLCHFHGPWAEEYRFSCQVWPGSGLRRMWPGMIAAVMRQVERRALRRAGRILTVSHYYEQQLPRWHGAGLPPIAVAGNGVDFEAFHPPVDRAEVRSVWGLAPEAFLFLAVRRLDPRMGLRVLLEGFSAVARDHPRAQLWIAGDGPQRGELESRRTQLGLDQRVRLLGWVPEARLPGLLAAADCGIMPSLDLEGFGLATAETLACGTPVLGSRAGATPELLEPLDAGLLFEAGSPTALADKLRAVLEGRLALPSPARCAAYAREHFSWEQPVIGLELAFRDLCLSGSSS